jgi:hypothetical protein
MFRNYPKTGIDPGTARFQGRVLIEDRMIFEGFIITFFRYAERAGWTMQNQIASQSTLATTVNCWTAKTVNGRERGEC